MKFFMQLLIAGISVGSVYALIGIGLNITYWTTRTLNFGYGAVMMMCAILVAYYSDSGINLILILFMAFIGTGLLGIIIERLAVRPALKSIGSIGWVISTLGFGIVLQGIAAMEFGSEAISFPQLLFKATDVINIADQPISLQYLSIFVIAIAVIVIFELVVRRTTIGMTMRAVAEDMEFAKVQGLPVNRVISISFVVSCLLAGLAGVLVSQTGGTVDAAFGFQLVLYGFVACVIGGIGNSIGTLVGGITVAILSKLAGGYISPAMETTLVFVILVGMLAIKPEGLFGHPEIEKV